MLFSSKGFLQGQSLSSSIQALPSSNDSSLIKNIYKNEKKKKSLRRVFTNLSCPWSKKRPDVAAHYFTLSSSNSLSQTYCVILQNGSVDLDFRDEMFRETEKVFGGREKSNKTKHMNWEGPNLLSTALLLLILGTPFTISIFPPSLLIHLPSPTAFDYIYIASW